MNPDFTPTQIRVNDLLAQQLKATGCRGGRLQLRLTSGAGLVSISGYHHSGKNVEETPGDQTLTRQRLEDFVR
ncbi:hypothetical protein [Hymenobacter negativus]|uniref:Uncharacterized protein n=1 Tax=Hymenobacter negativus TaxID=2795026 RepID=A0ABS3QDY2_9BACT|nr:hypothetical protein [Hymenobacter negativus]MBO2009440.1 hypothetical protein [Hymenobacter negativus]